MNDLKGKLHPYLRERIVGRVHLDVENSSLDDVKAAAGTAIERLVAQARARVARPPRRGRRPRRPRRGRPRVGPEALNEQRVEILLVGENLRSEGGRDPQTGMLYAGDHGPDDQPLERCENIVEPAIEKAIEQSAKVIKVRYHDDLGPLGGIGAVLRY